MRENTELEEGILIHINESELERVIKHYGENGYLERKNYPKELEIIAVPSEVGRFLLFRFILQ